MQPNDSLPSEYDSGYDNTILIKGDKRSKIKQCVIKI